eukprot:TRINITY_DN7682_c0_g1_i1.p1 TRINITY_DN7682_c0_g1~~TRINITY_DN7682_c0_g1_i1.p1  ORF type:complete len:627 (-),score=113.17 TRINITY_DN7682_c0_g1_i1:157-1764(-)
MAYWGIAFSLGINYNKSYMEPEEVEKAFSNITIAVRILEHSPEVYSSLESDLVTTLSHRYKPSKDKTRDQLETDYANIMVQHYEVHKEDVDYVALVCEAMMNLRPWELWKKDGTPEEGTLQIMEMLETAIRDHPPHMAIYHLYIHLIEMSPFPSKAIPVAEKLGSLAPRSGHLLHMPSHIWIRIGRYLDAVESNVKAVEEDRIYFNLRGGKNFYTLYRAHNIHFISYGSMFSGQYCRAVSSARELFTVLSPEVMAYHRLANVSEGLFGTLYHVLIRFGKWEEILQEPSPDSEIYKHSVAMYHYARGIAFAALSRIEEAEKEKNVFLQKISEIPEERNIFAINCRKIAEVAREMLFGEIEYRKGVVTETEEENSRTTSSPRNSQIHFKNAFEHFRRSVFLDDNLPYDEPWGWMQPTRHALGALLLERNQVLRSRGLLKEARDCVKEAEKSFREDLDIHPNNLWALCGLVECLKLRGEREGLEGELGEELVRSESELKEASRYSEVLVTCSCYCRLTRFPTTLSITVVNSCCHPYPR